MKKIGVIFGGRSDEHEISILSAASVISAIDKSKYEVVQLGINKNGDWFHITSKMDDIVSLDDSRVNTLIPKSWDGTKGADNMNEGAKSVHMGDLNSLMDFAFPVLHGPFGEDGTIQGMFEIMNIPYAGCGVTSSALSMDKIFTKEVWLRAGLPVCAHESINAHQFITDQQNSINKIEKNMEYPLFIKPANMGSSVGISRAENREQLKTAIKNALKYDNRIIIEKEIRGKELESAILGNNIVEAAEVGEIATTGVFYDYDSKYQDGKTELFIPADIPDSVRTEIRELAKKAFLALDGSGFSRVDFFLEEGTGNIYLNEMNTIPGFTRYSMFPLLWQEVGIEYSQLIERIIELGYERYNAKNNR